MDRQDHQNFIARHTLPLLCPLCDELAVAHPANDGPRRCAHVLLRPGNHLAAQERQRLEQALAGHGPARTPPTTPSLAVPKHQHKHHASAVAQPHGRRRTPTPPPPPASVSPKLPAAQAVQSAPSPKSRPKSVQAIEILDSDSDDDVRSPPPPPPPPPPPARSAKPVPMANSPAQKPTRHSPQHQPLPRVEPPPRSPQQGSAQRLPLSLRRPNASSPSLPPLSVQGSSVAALGHATPGGHLQASERKRSRSPSPGNQPTEVKRLRLPGIATRKPQQQTAQSHATPKAAMGTPKAGANAPNDSVLDGVLQSMKRSNRPALSSLKAPKPSLASPFAIPDIEKPDALLDQVLRWNFHEINDDDASKGISPTTPAAPRPFESYSEYVKHFEQLLVLEAWAQLAKAKGHHSEEGELELWDVEATIHSVDEIDGDSLVRCDVRLRDGDPHKQLFDNDLVYLTDFTYEGRTKTDLVRFMAKDQTHTLAFVSQVRPLRKQGGKGMDLLLSLPADSPRSRLVWTQLSPQNRVYLRRVASFSTITREYCAAASVGRFWLGKDVVFAKPSAATVRETPKLFPGLLKALNDSQIEAIKGVCSRSGIHLIQGPPGTGKTMTTIHLLSALLYCEPPEPSVIVPGQSLKSRSSQPAKHQRILVCAPSNAAVNEIAQRLVRLRLPRPSNSDFSPTVVRVPARSSDPVPQGLRPIMLETLVKAQLDGRSNAWEVRNSILQTCHVCLCTLSTTGSKQLLDANASFDIVIIDEAAQATEPSTIIPFRLAKTKLVLVGDPKQLNATVLSPRAAALGLEQSLFERLQNSAFPSHLLRVQYRMHPDISRLSSVIFYGGRLGDGANTRSVAYNRPHHNDPLLRPFVFVDVACEEQQEYINAAEVRAVVQVLRQLGRYYRPDLLRDAVGVITPYRKQAKELRESLAKELGFRWAEWVEVNTIDGFQGREKQVIVISCVRARKGEGIGFVAQPNRINVAITRALFSLVVIGSAETLCRHRYWDQVVAQARAMNRLVKF